APFRGMETLDTRFQAWLQERFGPRLGAVRVPERGETVTREQLEERVRRDPGDFIAQVTLGRLLFAEKRRDEAREHLERARALFPESGGKESPYWPLAQLAKDRGETREAAD